MTARRIFSFEFDDEGSHTLTFEYDGVYDQRLESTLEDGVPVIYLNKHACAVLARMFAKLALGSYDAGFHLHLEKDFNADLSEALRVVLIQ